MLRSPIVKVLFISALVDWTYLIERVCGCPVVVCPPCEHGSNKTASPKDDFRKGSEAIVTDNSTIWAEASDLSSTNTKSSIPSLSSNTQMIDNASFVTNATSATLSYRTTENGTSDDTITEGENGTDTTVWQDDFIRGSDSNATGNLSAWAESSDSSSANISVIESPSVKIPAVDNTSSLPNTTSVTHRYLTTENGTRKTNGVIVTEEFSVPSISTNNAPGVVGQGEGSNFSPGFSTTHSQPSTTTQPLENKTFVNVKTSSELPNVALRNTESNVLIAHKQDSRDAFSQDSTLIKSTNASISGHKEFRSAVKDGVEICIHADCVLAASTIMSTMDQTADPCEDFFQYACGSWNRKNVIPEDKTLYNKFVKLAEDQQLILRQLFEASTSEDEAEAIKKAKYLYFSCVNESLIEERGLTPVLVFVEKLGGWPVVSGATWNQSQFDMISLLAELRKHNNNILVKMNVVADDKQSDRHIITLDQPNLGMPSRDYFLNGRYDDIVNVYEKYAFHVAKFLGAETTTAEKDIKEMVDLEIRLANITVPREERMNKQTQYNKMTLQELSQNFTGFNWSLYLNRLFSGVNVSIEDEEEVVVKAPGYFTELMEVLQDTDNRTLANYLVWRILLHRVRNLPKEYRSVRSEFVEALYGARAEETRWRACTGYVGGVMGNAVGRMFVEDHFDEEAKHKLYCNVPVYLLAHQADDMIAHIRQTFYELLYEVPWMNNITRHVAEEKAEAIVEKIGYPEYIMNNTELDREFEDLEFDPEKYFENVLTVLKATTTASLRFLRQPVNKGRWTAAPAEVNAYYNSASNQITFPAGILQPPFYGKGYPKYLNYGGIGMVIGHEITHGFDDEGHQYDKEGNLKQWWSDDVINKFDKAAQCFVDQYSNFTLEEVSLNVNGLQTLGENIADNGGLKQAYRAYTNWVENDHMGREEMRLPGLEKLSPDQLFFLNFAQMWCGTMRPQQALNHIRSGEHSPGRFRVIGPVQNSPEFSEVFSCPVGSPMNPEKKCAVW